MNQSGIKKKNKCQQETNWSNIHTGPYNAGIESVGYLGEKEMPTEIKLVQNTHWSLQCWYTISLVLKRKTNANKTGIKLV